MKPGKPLTVAQIHQLRDEGNLIMAYGFADWSIYYPSYNILSCQFALCFYPLFKGGMLSYVLVLSAWMFCCRVVVSKAICYGIDLQRFCYESHYNKLFSFCWLPFPCKQHLIVLLSFFLLLGSCYIGMLGNPHSWMVCKPLWSFGNVRKAWLC